LLEPLLIISNIFLLGRYYFSEVLRPTPLAGSNNLAQSTRPRETRCKTSYAKRFMVL